MGRIGIFGGSFNPPHNGHILAAEELVRHLSLDRLYMIPASIPPHKQLPSASPDNAARCRLVHLAVAGHARLEVCELELQRVGISYTADTLSQLRKQHPDDTFYLLLGADMFLTLGQWYNPVQIMQECTIVLMQRQTANPDLAAQLQQQKHYLEKNYGAQVLCVENDFLELSSTLVRRMLVFGCGSSYLPPAVYHEICRLHVYGAGENLHDLSLQQLQNAVTGLLNPKRVPHVLGCSQTAVELANRWGANPVDAARAGLLHDVTKALPPEAQLILCEKYDIVINEFERENPKLLHAKTGAAMARYIFGENDAVYEAICWHTTGKAAMSLLEKILYLADYMEPNRCFDGVALLRVQAVQDLDLALYTALEMSVQTIQEKGALLDDNSRQARDYMKRQLACRNTACFE